MWGNFESSDLQIDEIKYKNLNPPTHFHRNEVTSVFQTIVDTYGIPTYMEANPAIFATVSFPFLFGVMFGDIGHGAVLLLFGLILCIYEQKLKQIEDLQMFLQMKYLLVLMGFFATYMGLIYNDFMSLPLNIFGRGCFTLNQDKSVFT
jgi:V-type H+-transporting ATPase subunit a